MMRRPGYDDVICFKHFTISSGLHLLACMVQLQLNDLTSKRSFSLYTGCFSEVHLVSLSLRETKLQQRHILT